MQTTEKPLTTIRASLSGDLDEEGVGNEAYDSLCDTPDGAWAEFLRHEEIHDPEDLVTIRRAMWAVHTGDPPTNSVSGPDEVLRGAPDSWPACQEIAQRYRKFTDGITAPSAALRSGGAHGWIVDGGHKSGPERNGQVIVLFGLRSDLVGWAASINGSPAKALL